MFISVYDIKAALKLDELVATREEADTWSSATRRGVRVWPDGGGLRCQLLRVDGSGAREPYGEPFHVIAEDLSALPALFPAAWSSPERLQRL